MKKLKHQYRNMIVMVFLQGGIYEFYPNMRNSNHRHFSTKQEKGFYFLHRAEYKDYPLKLRAARGAQLPHSWLCDAAPYVYLLKRNWKHNSKRPHQYYNHHYFE